ncbi:MAG: S-layer homology domain-containing protein [Sedimentibacter sp.]|uniref:S-layer homology domain-containing protein n=1 Tax=Sedimentibacter sp. TaxID=1960295 RepID=UPI0031582CA2
MKKVLSLVLVIAMVLSSMSFAFASTSFEDVAGNDYEDAINTLVALGVVTGYEDGTYRPEKTVTRAEMAKLMVELLGYGDLVAGSKSNFTDTQGHWADAYIALAAGKGLVVGTGDGKFTPDRTVSYDEAITMVVRALGYTDTCNELKNMTWPTNFKVKAAELKLTKDVAMNTTGADRGGVAQLMYNALEAILVTINSDGDVVKSYTTNSKNEIVYTKLLSRLATLETLTVDTDALDEDSKDYRGAIVDLAPYMYQSIDAYVNDDDEVVYVDEVNSVVVTGTVVDILDEAGNSIDDGDTLDIDSTNSAKDTVKVVIEDANAKQYKVAVTDGVVAFYNNDEETIVVENFASLLYSNSAAKVTAIVDDENGNDNGKVDNGEFALNLVVTKATKGILVKSDYVEGKTKITGVSANLLLPQDDGDVDVANITVAGAVDSLEDIKADDVVIAYEALNYSSDDSYPVKLVVVRDAVEGTVTKTNSSSKTIYIDGTSYKKSSITGAVAANTIQVNDEGVFYLDNAGKIFAVDTEAELVDYAVVLGKENGDVTTKFGTTDVDDLAQIKLATSEGETVVYDIYTTMDDNIIDDVATLNKTGDLVTLSGSTLVVNAAMVRGTLVKYSLDEDGYIDAIEVVATDVETIDTDDLDVMTVDSTVVFDATDDFNVVSIDNLEDGKSHDVAYFTSGSNKGKIAVIISSNVESVNDGVYGVISALNYVQNASGSKVVEVTALVNGEKVTFLTGKGRLTSEFAVTTTAAAYRFEFNSSDVLLSVENITANATSGTGDDADVRAFINATITDLDNDGMKVNTVQKFFSSDVAVYIYDQSDDSITIGDVSDLLESSDSNHVRTSAYVKDITDSSRIGIVVQVVK